MKELLKSHHPIRRLNSFKYAFRGIFHALMNEANFRIDMVITAFVVSMGIHFRITNTEWAILVLGLGFLLAAEIINTLIEELVDHLIHEHHEGARVIKDLSAGFVLTVALSVLASFCLVMWKYFFY